MILSNVQFIIVILTNLVDITRLLLLTTHSPSELKFLVFAVYSASTFIVKIFIEFWRSIAMFAGFVHYFKRLFEALFMRMGLKIKEL